MSIRVRNLALALLASLSLAGCASYADKNIAYQSSAEAPALQVPSGLDQPVTDRPMLIPAASAPASDEPLDVSAPNIIEASPSEP